MEKINFENLPSENTPVNSSNLNLMQSNIEKSTVYVGSTQPSTSEKVWIKRGKNLLDLEKCEFIDCTLNANGTITSKNQGSYYCEIVTKELNDFLLKNKGKTITFSIDTIIADRSISIAIFGQRASGSAYQEETVQSSNSVSLTIANDFTRIDSLKLRFNRGNEPFTDTSTTVGEVMLEKNPAKTSYEPYIKKEILAKDSDGFFERIVGEDEAGYVERFLIYPNPDFNSYIYHGITDISEIEDIQVLVREGSDQYRQLPLIYQENGSILPRFCISLYSFDAEKFLITAGNYFIENKANLTLKIRIKYKKVNN